MAMMGEAEERGKYAGGSSRMHAASPTPRSFSRRRRKRSSECFVQRREEEHQDDAVEEHRRHEPAVLRRQTRAPVASRAHRWQASWASPRDRSARSDAAERARRGSRRGVDRIRGGHDRDPTHSSLTPCPETVSKATDARPPAPTAVTGAIVHASDHTPAREHHPRHDLTGAANGQDLENTLYMDLEDGAW